MAQNDFVNIAALLLTTAGLWFSIYFIGSLIGRKGFVSSLRAGGKFGFWMALTAAGVIVAGIALYYGGSAIDGLLNHATAH